MKTSLAPKQDNELKKITILGSTGSVGRSTVDLVSGSPEKFKVQALTAYRNVQLLAQQTKLLGAGCAVIGDESLFGALKKELSGTGVRVEAGHEAVIAAAGLEADWTMAAIVGAAGIEATLQAIRQGSTVALANKESLVCAGSFMMDAVKKCGTTLLPVDSEHNAIFQVLDTRQQEQIRRVILTASGGPFLRKGREDLHEVTPEEAVRHPTWSMGAKISVDSATMMNKALEIIEASYLFNLKSQKIDVLIHPQSIVHSMVEYMDGSILSQMGAPDMRTPIAHALAWPSRMQTTGSSLDLMKNINLTFEPIDLIRFPAINIARLVLESGRGAATVFNAANEVAVGAFLSRKLKFSRIESIVEEVLQIMPIPSLADLAAVFELDREARRIAETVVARVECATGTPKAEKRVI